MGIRRVYHLKKPRSNLQKEDKKFEPLESRQVTTSVRNLLRTGGSGTYIFPHLEKKVPLSPPENYKTVGPR